MEETTKQEGKNYFFLISNPNKNSLTMYCAKKVQIALSKQGHRIHFCHLDEIGFDPILSTEEIQRRTSFDKHYIEHQELIQSSQHLVLFFPDWWGMPPALLLGWIQRIFAPGFAFRYTGAEFLPKEQSPLLSHLNVHIVISSDRTNIEDVLPCLDIFKHGVFATAGIKSLSHTVLLDTRNTSIHNKNIWIEETISALSSY